MHPRACWRRNKGELGPVTAGKESFFGSHASALGQLDGSQRATLTVMDLDSAAAASTELRHSLGVYAIWEAGRFLYVGSVVTVPDVPETRLAYGKTPESLVLNPRARGLYGRLRTHA